MLNLLEQLSESVATGQTVEELTRPLLEMLETVTSMESTYLTSIDELQAVQQVLYARNAGRMTIPEGLAVPWSDTLCKRALDEGRTFTNDVPDRWGDSDAARALGIQTYVSKPIRLGDGTLFGTLCAASTQQHPRSAEAERFLTLFAYLIGQQVERERLIQKLVSANEQLLAVAALDPLTELPNRRTLEDALARMLAQGRRQDTGVQIAFIDLDGFKAINDAHGHAAGDQFLIAIAKRLTSLLRKEDLAARLGGDEFVVVSMTTLTGDAARAAQDALSRRITQATQGRFYLNGVPLDYAGASVGVVTINPDENHATDTALRVADETMYEVKRLRRETGLGQLTQSGALSTRH